VSRPGAADPVELIRWGTPAARWVLLATVAGSGLAFLDGTTVNVALPALGDDLDASVAGLQWTLNAYTLTLASLILLGGTLGDRYGRRRVFQIGVVWFATASLLCGAAPNVEVLVACRALQGVGGALLTPGSLAILQASFVQQDRARAVGAWSGLSGIAAAAGPVVGGYLVDALSWRWIFLTNVPVAVLVFVVTARHVPESNDPAAGSFDGGGALLAASGLGVLTWALIAAGEQGGSASVVAGVGGGLALLAAFVVTQRRRRHPMVPPAVFASRQFTGANLVTFTVYAGLSVLFFLLVVHLQQVAGYSALMAGSALLPITALLLALSARAGDFAERAGPRAPLTVGPLIMAGGLLLALRIGTDASYLADVLPAAAVFGLGLAFTVAPLTATVLAAVEERHTGLASGVNNAVSRTGGLIAVAVVPVAAGLTGDAYRDPAVFAQGFRVAMLISAAVVALGGALAAVTIRNRLRDDTPACPPGLRVRRRHCAVDGAPLEPAGVPGAVRGPDPGAG
jgi:EmrB/QacA subfamily drug resistance transporter